MFLVGFPVTVHCEGIELVSWGQPETIGAHYRTTFTGAERAYWIIENVPPYLKGIIVGLILGDCCVNYHYSRSKNARLLFGQSLNNSSASFKIGAIISAMPNFRVSSRNGVPFYALRLWTSCLPFLTELRSLFYPNGIK